MAGFWRDYRENWVATLALAVVVLIVAAALAAPLITPQDPYDLANLMPSQCT
jgi:peptide/nickel transport system permease protein